MEKFTWIKTFEQISEWLLSYQENQSYLVSVLNKIGIEGGLLDYELEEKYLEVKTEKSKEAKKGLITKNTIPLNELDPFTFIALILKNSKFENLVKLLSNLNEEIPELYIPLDFKGVPTPNPQGSWFFAFKYERNSNDIEILWDLFKSIHRKEEIEDKFNAALDVKYTALASLTQMLFVFFPTQFFPVDGQTQEWLASRDLPYKKKIRWAEYSELINTLKNNYRVNFAYLSHTCWFINQWEFDKIKAEELLSVRLNRITDGVEYIKGFVTSEGKQIALEVSNKSNYFNIIFEEKIPDDLNLKFEFKKVGNANLERHAPKLANREVCVIRTSKNFDWYNFLLILDWYEGSNIMLIDSENKNESKSDAEDFKNNFPLNQILYGPPGTGKTYATTELSVQIADPEWYFSLNEKDPNKRHKAIKEKYDELINAKQIAFTTFHQSFSYEDFIEGLRAFIPEDQDKIAYKVEDGIFKKIALVAEKAQGIDEKYDFGLNESPKIWKISIGDTGEVDRRNQYIAAGEARIGWNETGDLSTGDKNDYYNSLGSNAHSTLAAFSQEMRIGDVVLCLKDNKNIQAIGVVQSDYSFDTVAAERSDKYEYAHVRKVNWIAKNIKLNILKLNKDKVLVQKTLYELHRMSWSKIVEELKVQSIEIENITNTVTIDKGNLNYVLIMDEINRGNISKIFGELITLIEDDKRSGKFDARELILPYSKEPFTVPSNLYLIGTMNTADKSLTQLDLALRRRFEFKEVGPDIKILEGLEASQHDIAIPLMLKKMNQRIQYLRGKDYQIGHSYFMPLCQEMDKAEYLKTLRRIFENKIIPLLQEYFFSNLKHIGLVLNDNPSDDNERKIINDLNLNDNIFGHELPPKANPLYAVELNLGCFSDLSRFQQIYQ